MITFIFIIHAMICVALIGIVLIQRGRGSGLVESFSGVESMFGTKTSSFLTRTTTILSILFFITCLSLAALSIARSRSLMKNVKPAVSEKKDVTAEQAAGTVSPAKATEEAKPQAAQPQQSQSNPKEASKSE